MLLDPADPKVLPLTFLRLFCFIEASFGRSAFPAAFFLPRIFSNPFPACLATFFLLPAFRAASPSPPMQFVSFLPDLCDVALVFALNLIFSLLELWIQDTSTIKSSLALPKFSPSSSCFFIFLRRSFCKRFTSVVLCFVPLHHEMHYQMELAWMC